MVPEYTPRPNRDKNVCAGVTAESGCGARRGRDRPLTALRSRNTLAGNPAKAYVSFVALGDALPAVPLFLTADRYVELELEPGYTEAYTGMPAFWRNVIEKRPA